MGGVDCNPIACLRRENTITILVKEVTIKIRVGARTKRVKIIAILIVFTNCAGSSNAATERFTIGAVSAAKMCTAKNNRVNKNFKKNPM